MSDKGYGVLQRKYLPYPDDKFGIWADEKNFYIGNRK